MAAAAASASAAGAAAGVARGRFPGRPWGGRSRCGGGSGSGSRGERARVPLRVGGGAGGEASASGLAPDPALLQLLGLSWRLRRLREVCGGGGGEEQEEEFCGFRNNKVVVRSHLRSALRPHRERRNAVRVKEKIPRHLSPALKEASASQQPPTKHEQGSAVPQGPGYTLVEPAALDLGFCTSAKSQDLVSAGIDEVLPDLANVDPILTSSMKILWKRQQGSSAPKRKVRNAIEVPTAKERSEGIKQDAAPPVKENMQLPLKQKLPIVRVVLKKIQQGTSQSRGGSAELTARVRVDSKDKEVQIQSKNKEDECSTQKPPIIVKFVSKAKKMKATQNVLEPHVKLKAPGKPYRKRGGGKSSGGCRKNAVQAASLFNDLDKDLSPPAEVIQQFSTEPVENKNKSEVKAPKEKWKRRPRQSTSQTVEPGVSHLLKEEAAPPTEDVEEVHQEPVAGQLGCMESPSANLLTVEQDETSNEESILEKLTLKKGRGRPPLTPDQKAERRLAQQLLAKEKESAPKKERVSSQQKTPEELQAARRTLLKNIRRFIMPVMSARSSRIIKTPRRFMDEELELLNQKQSPGKAERTVEVSKTQSIVSESTQEPILSSAKGADSRPYAEQEEDGSSSSSEAESIKRELLEEEMLKPIIPASPKTDSTLTASSPASSVTPPPPQIPLLTEKRRSILREPVFRWTSICSPTHDLSPSTLQTDSHLAKPLFRFPSTTADDGLLSLSPASVLTSSQQTAPCWSQGLGKVDSCKRVPLLRAPQFTPSEAHLKIYEAVSISAQLAEPKPVPDSISSSLSPFTLSLGQSDVELVPRSNCLASSEDPELERKRDSMPKLEFTGQTLAKSSGFSPPDPICPLGAKQQAGIRTNHLTLPQFPESPIQNVEPHNTAERSHETEMIKIVDMDCPGVVRKVVITRVPCSFTETMSTKPDIAKEDLIGISETDSSNEDPASSDSEQKATLECEETKRKEHRPEGTIPLQKMQLSGMEEKMINLLKKAKVQLFQIDQQKYQKPATLSSLQAPSPPPPQAPSPALAEEKKVEEPLTVVVAASLSAIEDNSQDASMRKMDIESPLEDEQKPRMQSQECLVQGPRIKHVCRHASVALGQQRAVVPEDMPRLSTLPLRDREESTALPATVDVETSSASESEIGGSHQKRGKVESVAVLTTSAPVRSAKSRPRPGKKLRMPRCGTCKGCRQFEDCGKCVNCLDKTKFGGRNTKKQCCIYRRCDKIEARKLERMALKGRTVSKPPPRDTPPDSDDSTESWRKVCERGEEETETSDRPEPDGSLQRKSARRCVKQRPYYDIFEESDESDYDLKSASATLRRKHSRDSDFLPLEPGEELSRPRKTLLQPVVLKARKGPVKASPASRAFIPLLNGCNGKQKTSDGIHRVRVDFKEDCDLENVWLMGGLSILTSVPVMTPLLCLLCASKGLHEMVYCQVCCEPFHMFCLEEDERPLPEQVNWCCRRCKFCHVCGRKSKASKQLLECERCRNSYHLACLGPNYPTKPFRKRKGWICSTCIRCKNCGIPPGKNWDVEWSHDYSLCSDCTTLYEKGNYCPICTCCYEDNDYESKMIQCAGCEHWVHAKCEGLSDEGYEILSNLPDSVVYKCKPCRGSEQAEWKNVLQSELKEGLQQVLQGLLTSKLTTTMLQCPKCFITGGEEKVHQRPCDLRMVSKLFEEGHYKAVKSFTSDVANIIQSHIIEEKDCTDKRVGTLAKSFYTKLMEQYFSWFNAQDSKYWEQSKTTPNGMLPNAVLPPSSDHVYAQWRERDDVRPTENSLPLGKEPPPLGTKVRGKSLCKSETTAGTEDSRQCALCLKYGDDEPKDAGRLLYIGQNEWTHINCAIWSAEVFEENDGSLKNVHAAVARGRQMRCDLCQKPGATVGCCLAACLSNFHFMCARASRCIFQDDKKMFCENHVDLLDGQTVPPDSFDVLRRVYVDFEGISFKRKFLVGLEPESIRMMIGSMKIDSLGMLTDLSDCEGRLFPVGYQCSRLYWSTVDARRRCWYKCRILEHRPAVTEEEPDITAEKGTNHTIAHGPATQLDIQLMDQQLQDAPLSSLALERHSPSQNPGPLPPPQPILATSAPRLFSGARIKIPNYSPSRRPLGGSSRPLPSPGSPTSVPHHILTVSDPDVTPMRRARRHSPMSHSSSSIPRSRLASPPRQTPGISGSTSLRTGTPQGVPWHRMTMATLGSAKAPRLGPLSNQSTSSTEMSTHMSFATAQTSTSRVQPASRSGQEEVENRDSWVQGVTRNKSTWSSVQRRQDVEILESSTCQKSEEREPRGQPEILSSALPDNGGGLVPEFCSVAFDESDMEVVSSLNASDLEFDESILSETFQLEDLQCGAQIVVPADTSEIEDEEGGCSSSFGLGLTLTGSQMDGTDDSECSDKESYLLTRTVVASQHLSPHLMELELPHIKQLDGVDDGTESDTSTTTTDANIGHIAKKSKCSEQLKALERKDGSHSETNMVSGVLANTRRTPEDLEIEIVDVLKSSGIDSRTEKRLLSPPQATSQVILGSSHNGTEKVNSLPPFGILSPKVQPSTLVVPLQAEGSTSQMVNGNDNALLWLSTGGCSSTPGVQGFSLKDPPQLQRAYKSFSLEPSHRQVHAALIEPPTMTAQKPDSKIILVNKLGQVFVKMQNNANIAATTPEPALATSAVHGTTETSGGNDKGLEHFPSLLKQHDNGVSPIMCTGPQLKSTSSAMDINQIAFVRKPLKPAPNPITRLKCKSAHEKPGMAVSAAPQQNLGTVLLQASAPLGVMRNDVSTWTLLPMVNVMRTEVPVNTPRQITLGLQQTCVLQHVPMNPTLLNLSALASPPLQSVSSYNPVDNTLNALHLSHTPTVKLASSATPLNKFGSHQAKQRKRVSSLARSPLAKKSKLLKGVVPPPEPERSPANCVLSTSSLLSAGFKTDDPVIQTGIENEQSNRQSSSGVQLKTPTVKEVLEVKTLKEESLSEAESRDSKSVCDFLSPSVKTEDSRPESPEHEHEQEPLEDPPWYKYSGDPSSSDEDVPSLNKENEEPRKNQPHLRFEISNEDGFSVTTESIDSAWKAVIDKVQEARGNSRLRHLSFTGMNGVRMLGIHHDAVLFLLEQLQGAERCCKYKFRFHQHEEMEEELPVNPSGCTRAEVYLRKCTFDMFNFLASQHRMLPEGCPYDEEEDEVQLKSSRRATSLELPMAMRYRHLKKTSKEAVGVYRSAIHGRGLFCKRNIDAGEMVIEYSGIVIRSVLTDKREKYYDGKGIGCYMFRIDDFDVVDATMHGNAARFINHSCEPNCYSRVIHVEGQKHIVIFALRKIYRGEELTYDYKFPIEDANNKLPCNCGAKKCRRFLN
ncbi:histone-lysine N-methyltransferase 2B [Rhinatrema bivittatum]|uniref:histone-lysine N-methyltransferase 2B n=1 Tax=Rhinatrema bivittatum TaxID=194408 RepID=UPI0011270491|nr:histone-lysine N-methyltransferase 2B [Rhinatrema bivittatum]